MGAIMKLIKVIIENFMSFGRPQHVVLSDVGLVFVEGLNFDDPVAKSNGSGKSGIPEAIIWALTGFTLRGLTGDDVINVRVRKNCRVILEGVTDNGNGWTIERYRKVNREDGLRFYIGKKLMQTTGVRETQALIDETLGTNYDVLSNSVVFGQGADHFTKLTDGPRKKFLDSALHFTEISQALERARSKVIDLTTNRVTLTGMADQLDAKIEAAKASINAVTANYRAQRDARLREIEAEIVDLSGHLKRKHKVDTTAKEIEAEIDRLAAKHERMSARAAKLKKRVNIRVKKSYKMLSAVGVLRDECGRLASLIDSAGMQKSDTTCELCGGAYTEEGLERHVEHLTEQYGETQKSMQTQQDEMNAYRAETAALSDKQESLDALAQRVWSKKVAAEKRRLSVADRELDDKRTKESLDVLRVKRERLRNDNDPPGIAKLEADCVKWSKEKNGALVSAAEMAKELALYQFWVEGFGNAGVKSYMLDYVTPLLNARAAEYSRYLMGGLTVEFDTQTQLKGGGVRDKFDVSVTNSHGAPAYVGSSGGERRKIDIVVAKTLQSLVSEQGSFNCNVSFWDEPFDALDESSAEAVMSLLREEAKVKGSVFVVSHNDWLRPYFSRVLRVTKRNGASTVEWTT